MMELSRPAGSGGPAGRTPVVGPTWLIVALAAALFATTLMGVRVLRPSTVRVASEAVAIDVVSQNAEQGGIDALQRRLRDVPGDVPAWAALGSAYVEQGRITGDPTFYPKAEQALRRTLSLDPRKNFEAFAAMGALAAARHDFIGALAWGNRARAANPYNAGAYGVVGDALIELGRYPEAFAALQRMVDLRPSLASYARASYAWELQGNVPNAIHAMELALEAAGTPSDAAFASYHLGELSWNAGRTAEALRWYRQSARDPTYVPAMQGIAKVAAAHGRLDEAIKGYEAVVARLPLPQYVIELGDLYTLAGKPTLAKQQFDLLAVQQQLFRANGVNVDLEQALFDADHGVDVTAGLAAAQSEWRRRESVFVADTLAWSLYAGGRYREALTLSNRALLLGTQNALFLFHKGMIERALGLREPARRDLSRALAINPHFSFLWAPRVASIVEEIT